MKRCPFCAEEIQDAAIVCRYCNRDLSASKPTPEMMTCPFCKASVPKGSKVCPSCHDDISGTGPEATPTQSSPPPPAAPSTWRSGLGLLAAGAGFVLTMMSTATAGVGVLMLWIGLAFVAKGGVILRWGGTFLVALVLGSLGMSIGGGGRSTPAPPTVPAPTSPTTSAPSSASRAVVGVSEPVEAYDLVLLSSRGYESEYGGYHYVEGQVKNVSDKPLENVAAVATWYAKDGTFIKSDDALIDYNPIMPGQTSPFKTISSGNPLMSKYTVDFKTLFGRALRVDDQRKK